MSELKRRLCAVLVAAASLVAPTGCGTNDSIGQGTTSDLTGAVVKLPDGRHVTCVANSQDTRSGVSCDWRHAK